MIRVYSLIFLLLPVFIQAQVRTGAERTELYFPLLKGRDVGVVANQASVVGGVNVVDAIVSGGFVVTRIFSPEHGFRLAEEAGKIIGNSVDSATGIEVVSLYGTKKKPAPADLSGLDLIVFDIQDVGARFYTYISTLTYVMEACAEAKLPLILLDRPNPNGYYIDGPVLEPEFPSFVGLHPVPVVYGMTIGEYACMVNGQGWLKGGMKCDLRVIPMENYTHRSRCVLPERPSPNLPNEIAVKLYPSLCFFEGTCISAGRGTPYPFQVYGYPGSGFGTFMFTPESIPGISLHPPLEGEKCNGEDLRNYYVSHPADEGKLNLNWLIKAYNGRDKTKPFFNGFFNKLAGNATLQQQITDGISEKKIRESWKPGIEKFRKIRQKYLIY